MGTQLVPAMNRLLAVVLLFALVGLSSAAGAEKITLKNFEEKVINNDYVWAIKYASKYCGSCQEFDPHWTKVAKEYGNKLKFGVVSIDDKDGQELAASHGAMEEGIPNVKVFTSHVPETLVKGDSISAAELKKKIDGLVGGLNKSNGFYVKSE